MPEEAKLKITISEEELAKTGFTDSGKKRFSNTVIEYSNLLFDRSTKLADLDKGRDCSREVTHGHIGKAASDIASSYGKRHIPKWLILTQVLEYVGTAIVGWSANHLDQSWGILTFGIVLSIVVILLVIRLIKKGSE